MSRVERVPPQGWYIAAGGAVLAGVLVAVALIAWMLLSRDDGMQFAVPGRTAVELRAGEHLVWNDYRTAFEGQRYESAEQVPLNAVIRVRDPSGAALATRLSPSRHFSTGKTERRALLEFTASQPGRHEIVVEGAFERRVFSVGPDRTLRSIGATLGAFVAVFVGLAVGFALWTWTFFKRDAAAERAARAAAPQQPQQAHTIGADEQSLRKLTALVYGLQLAGYFTGFSPLAGVIINYVKRDAVAGTWLESHFRWQIRTFWITLACSLLGMVLLLVFIGLFVLGVAAMWFLYRAIKGWIELSEGKPMYGP